MANGVLNRLVNFELCAGLMVRRLYAVALAVVKQILLKQLERDNHWNEKLR